MAKAPDQTTTALLTEHLTYTPLTFIDEAINLTNSLVYASCSEVEEFFKGSAPTSLGFRPPDGGIYETDDDGNELLDQTSLDEIMNGMHQLEMLFENGVDRSFDGFELFALRNIFTLSEDIRDFVRLQHHKDLDFSHRVEPGGRLPKMENIMKLRQQIHELTTEEEALKAEIARNKATISTLKSIVHPPPPAAADSNPTKPKAKSKSKSKSAEGEEEEREQPHPLSFLFRQTAATQAVKPIPETAAFTVQQVQTLRQMVTSLRAASNTLIKKVSAGSEGAGGANEAMDVDARKSRERNQYVEKMSRRHLERARGLNLTADGALKSGDGEFVGERKGEEEATQMEALAGAISERRSGGDNA